MKFRAVLASIGMMMIANVSQAQDNSEWSVITYTDAIEWQGKKKSGQLTNVDGGKNNGYAYIAQKRDKNSNKLIYTKIFVLLSSCKKGYGFIYFNDLAGNFDSKGQFVRHGDKTLGDHLGTAACTSWDADTGKVSMQPLDDAWEFIARNSKGTTEYHFKKDTLKKVDHKGKKSISILERDSDLQGNTFSYYEAVVHISDCKQGYGRIYYLDFDRKEVSGTDYVINGNSMGAAAATALCAKV